MAKYDVWIGVLAMAVLAFVGGCKDEVAQSCPRVTGVFLASYQWLEGSCGNFTVNSLKVAEDDHGTVTKVETRLSDVVTTEMIFKGCTLAVKQSVAKEGLKESLLAGDLKVRDETEFAGMMSRTEYMETGAIRCHSVYEARYVRQDVIVGGAVEHADTAP